ncbi:MAG: DUF4381 family protein [Chthoniobacterales bacterium]|nr:DUF4381 family protein [Chthoniobacterales bacterium]
MNPAAPSSTPVPIHDIVGPVWFFPWPVWVVVTVSLGVLALVAILVWGVHSVLSRRKPPTARERALGELEGLRSSVSGADPYAFGIQVSDAIRTYIHDQHGLQATTQTSLEFLEGLRGNPIFTDNEKAGLSVFLEKTDLLKYARAEAGESEMIGLLETAGRLVRSEAQPGKNAEAVP